MKNSKGEYNIGKKQAKGYSSNFIGNLVYFFPDTVNNSVGNRP
ncbi:MAG TPA: hypothetical protein VI564_05095 [Candidatus Nanoarchaeia archaeon]|nr:hypothetical protein [Candidatus Nanoarchaeia archaeon]